MVKRLSSDAPARAAKAEPPPNDVHTRAAEDRMHFALGAKVRIVRKNSGGASGGDAGGVIEIAFGSEDELNRLYTHITARS
jgi:hypothetical protein